MTHTEYCSAICLSVRQRNSSFLITFLCENMQKRLISPSDYFTHPMSRK